MTTRAGTSTRALVVALLTALAVTGISGGAGAGAVTSAPTIPQAHRATSGADTPASARLASCRRSPLIDERTAVVGTTMRPLDGATRLAMRIDLYQRPLAGGRWTLRGDVPGLGIWTTPSDALLGTRVGDVFKYRQAVGRLVVPAAYRFHVGFRWLNDAGAVVRETVATTGICRQPDLRPDLVLRDARAAPSPRGGDLVRYTLVVGNDGRSPAARVAVAATLPGETTPLAHARGVGTLDPGEAVVVSFTGPGCAAGDIPAAFAVDPANAVDESREANNQLAALCPAP